ncbi:hypothetical protein ACIQVE_01060 [Pseudomonas sp. NPDC098747]|uniref:hypothetical protein n=1 Tax=Pseudomonas sp. NPDC098747 TaxID=3364487 RepID=UPI00383BCB01
MRYLKVTAQDRSANNRADTLLLHFFEENSGAEDTLIHRAYALDITADGKVDFQAGDVNNDGKENIKDERLLKSFANAFVQLNWFNPGATGQRYMKVYAQDFYADGTPDTVRLHLYEGTPMEQRTLASWHAAYDLDNDSKLEWNIHHDINQDGVIDAVDDRLVATLAETFLKFQWK